MENVKVINNSVMSESLYLLANALNLTDEERAEYEGFLDDAFCIRADAWKRFLDEALLPAFADGQTTRLVKATTGGGCHIARCTVEDGYIFVREDFFGKCELVCYGGGSLHDRILATYSDKTTMCEMIMLLADAIRKGDAEFTFPTQEEVIELRQDRLRAAWHKFVEDTLAPAFADGQKIDIGNEYEGGHRLCRDTAKSGCLAVREDSDGKCKVVFHDIHRHVIANYADKMTTCEIIMLLADAIRAGEEKFTFPSQADVIDLRRELAALDEYKNKKRDDEWQKFTGDTLLPAFADAQQTSGDGYTYRVKAINRDDRRKHNGKENLSGLR